MASAARVEQAGLVVVGASVGGLVTAVTAADHGHRVVVIERSKDLGGLAATSAESIAAAGTRFQRVADVADTRVTLRQTMALPAQNIAGIQIADDRVYVSRYARYAYDATPVNGSYTQRVIDDGGHLIYLVTMDGTQVGSIHVAQEKAQAALRFKRSTKLFQDMVVGDKPHMAFLPGAVPVEGGLPLFVDGQIYGAIGVSGMPSDKDGIVAQAGADFAATLK